MTTYEIFQELDDHRILMNLSELCSRIKWPQNSYEILQGFWSELWLPALVSNNSDDYRILQELGDRGILVKFTINTRALDFLIGYNSFMVYSGSS